jgi:hypothetical protein
MSKARQPGAALESSVDRPGPAGPVAIPMAPDKPRFTMPDPVSTAALGIAPRPRSRAGLWLAIFAVAIFVVACVSAALAFGLREISFP